VKRAFLTMPLQLLAQGLVILLAPTKLPTPPTLLAADLGYILPAKEEPAPAADPGHILPAQAQELAQAQEPAPAPSFKLAPPAVTGVQLKSLARRLSPELSHSPHQIFQPQFVHLSNLNFRPLWIKLRMRFKRTKIPFQCLHLLQHPSSQRLENLLLILVNTSALPCY
jgi:hypothetical protein